MKLIILALVLLFWGTPLHANASELHQLVTIERSIVSKELSDADFTVYFDSNKLDLGAYYLENIKTSQSCKELFYVFNEDLIHRRTKLFDYDDIKIAISNLYQEAADDYVYDSFVLKTDKVSTNRNIRVGMTKEDIIGVYGKNYRVGECAENSIIIYTLDGKSIFFYLSKDGVLEKIELNLVFSRAPEGEPPEPDFTDSYMLMNGAIEDEETSVFDYGFLVSDIITLGTNTTGKFELERELFDKFSLTYDKNSADDDKYVEYTNFIMKENGLEPSFSFSMYTEEHELGYRHLAKQDFVKTSYNEETDETIDTPLDITYINANGVPGCYAYLKNENGATMFLYLQLDEKTILKVDIFSQVKNLFDDGKIKDALLSGYISPKNL